MELTESAPATAATGAESLVARAARGDAVAFAALVETRADRVFRTARAILGSEADARDVTQEAFLSAWRHLPSLRDGDRFDAWLNRVVVNRCRDALRRRNRIREIAIDELVVPTARDEIGSVAEVAALNAAFEGLTADERQLLVLHHLHHLPVGDLARQLGVPLGTAKWRLHAARRSLERALEAQA